MVLFYIPRFKSLIIKLTCLSDEILIFEPLLRNLLGEKYLIENANFDSKNYQDKMVN